jgi:NAD(P)-binding Rossmann-like domain
MSSHLNTPHHVVILGGGITGLSAAFHLARKHPTLRITLVEKSNRFGGWVRSDRVEVYDNNGNRGSVLLESGPRSIRPNSKSILELVRPPFTTTPHSDRPLNGVLPLLPFFKLDTSPRFAFQSPIHATGLTRRPKQVLARPSFTGIATPALQSLIGPHASPRSSRPQSLTHRTLRKPQSSIVTITSWERRRGRRR